MPETPSFTVEDALRSALGAGWRDRAESYATILIGPDAFVAGQAGAILGLLAANGFQARSAQLVALTKDIMLRVHTDLSFDPALWTDTDVGHMWDWVDRMYGLAPSALVFLDASPGPATNRLTLLKGFKRPEGAAEDTIRHLCDSESVILNLVHTPDGLENAMREAATMIGSAQAARHFAHLAGFAGDAPDPAAASILDPRAVLARAEQQAGRSALSLPHVVNAIRMRVAQQLALRLHTAGRDLGTLPHAHEVLRKESQQLDSAVAMSDRISVARETSATATNLLIAAADGAGRRGLTAALNALHTLFDVTAERDLTALDQLPDEGVYVSPLEQTVLHLHHFAFRPNDYLLRVYPPLIGAQ